MSDPTDLTARQKRAAHPLFIPTFSLAALAGRLPLRIAVPDASAAPSPKRKYRSGYRYMGWEDLGAPARRANMSLFEVALRLIDFASLRDLLAGHYQPSDRGQVAFDPVSLFLAVCLRREMDWSWDTLTKTLAGEHGAAWRTRLGFTAATPSASGLRYFQNAVAPATFVRLCPLLTECLHEAGVLPKHSTFPGDPAARGVTISHDIMLHQARSCMRCSHVCATCYQKAPRPCPAREAGKPGCDCTGEACKKACHLATPLDPEARSIYYSGRNKHDEPNGEKSKGKLVFGYASNPDRLLDDRFAVAWTVRTDLHAANSDERALFPASFAQLQRDLGGRPIGEVLADAAVGFEVCLLPIWQAGALRMVDTRADKDDPKPATQHRRGYDDHGHPRCVHGYTMQSNGHDYARQRTKWCCAKACLNPGPDGAPPNPPDCPWLAAEHKHGQVLNIGFAMPDGSPRLAREVPHGSPTWKVRYGRRNLSESRNGSMEHMGLKRLPCHGIQRGLREVATADFLVNLHTLSSLVCQATDLAAQAA